MLTIHAIKKLNTKIVQTTVLTNTIPISPFSSQ